jgi:urate oxidase
VGISLGDNQYGKAEIRLVQLSRQGDRHGLTDLSVSVALRGELTDVHLSGDNSAVLPTDTQKNTVYAFARQYGVGEIESFALRLARHFVHTQPAIEQARVHIEQYGWDRLGPHSFQRNGVETRLATATCAGTGSGVDAWVVSGLADLVLMNSTDSEFRGFAKDAYTTLAETGDRILATAVNARWRHGQVGDGDVAAQVDWAESYVQARRLLVEAFTGTYSRSLQQTLYAMGSRVLAGRPEIVEVRLALPNRHHFVVDLAPFGLDNPNEVFHADDRPYGLIEGTVLRDDAPPAGPAWQ